jgi:hypothetical protein
MEVEHVSLWGHSYTMIVVDDHTRYAWVYFLKNKSEAPETLKAWAAFVERQLGKPLKGIRSDRGGEYLADSLVDWLEEKGISHNLSVPYTPQQNGVAERYNRTMGERARSMLFKSGLPPRFWVHAFRYAVWITNRVPTSSLQDHDIPYRLLRGKPPDLGRAKVFGCLAQVWIHPDEGRKKHKLARRAQWGIFLGVPATTMGWEFYLPAKSTTGHHSRTVVFYEDQFLRDWKVRYRDEADTTLEGEWVDPFPGLRSSEEDEDDDDQHPSSGAGPSSRPPGMAAQGEEVGSVPREEEGASPSPSEGEDQPSQGAEVNTQEPGETMESQAPMGEDSGRGEPSPPSSLGAAEEGQGGEVQPSPLDSLVLAQGEEVHRGE